ncbi:MAG: efflux RND transporter periplasmic adaptor subunit, partial [Pseudomonadota bacterium]
SQKRLSFVVLAGLLVGGGLIIAALLLLRPEPERAELKRFAPTVDVLTIAPEDLAITVEAQGNVEPQRQIDLVSQVGGKVTKIAGSLFAGEFFASEQTLVWIDDRDFKNALTRAEADVASARQQLALEQAESDQAARDWELLGGEGEPTPLVLRKPQLAEAQARLNAAEASLADAKLNLERTQLSAPFAGRVRQKNVDIGQFVSPGQAVGTVYATDVVEIRLPLTDRQAGFLDLPMSPRQNMAPVPVTINATIGGVPTSWEGLIRRTDGAIDPRSRVVVAIADVADPFNLGPDANAAKAPLSVGLFVTAQITGKRYKNVFRLPRRALRDNNVVITVNSQNRLDFKSVTVLRTTAEYAYIQEGLKQGDMLLMTDIDAPIDGMEVEIGTRLGGGAGASIGSVSAGGAP